MRPLSAGEIPSGAAAATAPAKPSWASQSRSADRGRDGSGSPCCRTQPPIRCMPILPRAHRAISNLKTWLAGTHRGTSVKHLQVYLDEFAFRHNRRRVPMAVFQTLFGLSALHTLTTYNQITAESGAT
jgi:hypothetical protein